MPNNKDYIQDPVLRQADLSGEIARGKAKNAGKSEAEQEKAAELARKSYVDAYDKELKDRKHLTEDEKDAYAKAYASARVDGKSGKDARAEGNKAAKKRRKERPEENRRKQEFEQQQIQLASSVNNANMGMSTVDAQNINMSPVRESQLISKRLYISLVYSVCPKDKMLPQTEDYERINKDLEKGVDSFMLFPLCNFIDIEGQATTPNADVEEHIYIDCSKLSMRIINMELKNDIALKEKLLEGIDSVYKAYMRHTNFGKDDCELFLTIAANEVILDLAYMSIYGILGNVKFVDYKSKVRHKRLVKFVDSLDCKNEFDTIRNNGNILKLHYLCKIDWVNTWVQLAQSYMLEVSKPKSTARKVYDGITTTVHFVLGIAGALVPHPAIKAILILSDLLLYEIDAFVYWLAWDDTRAQIDSWKGFQFSLAFALIPLPFQAVKKHIGNKAAVAAAGGMAKSTSREVATKEAPNNTVKSTIKSTAKSSVGVVHEGKIFKLYTLAKEKVVKLGESLAEAKQLLKNAEEQLPKLEAELKDLKEAKNVKQLEDELKALQERKASVKTAQQTERNTYLSQVADTDDTKAYFDYMKNNTSISSERELLSLDTQIAEKQKEILLAKQNNKLQIEEVSNEIRAAKEYIDLLKLRIKMDEKAMTFAQIRKWSLEIVNELFNILTKGKEIVVDLSNKVATKDTAVKAGTTVNNAVEENALALEHKIKIDGYTFNSLLLSNMETFMDKPYMFANLEKYEEVNNLKSGKEIMLYSAKELFTEDVPFLLQTLGEVLTEFQENESNRPADYKGSSIHLPDLPPSNIVVEPTLVWDINGA